VKRNIDHLHILTVDATHQELQDIHLGSLVLLTWFVNAPNRHGFCWRSSSIVQHLSQQPSRSCPPPALGGKVAVERQSLGSKKSPSGSWWHNWTIGKSAMALTLPGELDAGDDSGSGKMRPQVA